MIWENVLKSLLFATMLASCGIFIYHVRITETPVLIIAFIGGGIFILTVFLLRYPTQKRVAARVDAG